MKLFVRMFLILLAITLCISLFASPSHAKVYKGLFIYWRGETPCGAGFKEGLKNLGYETEIVEFNCNKDKNKMNDFLSSIKEDDYDFFYTFGTTVSVAASQHIKKKPLFFGLVTDPVKCGLIKSWQNSGNNITGVSHSIPFKDQTDFIMGLGALKKIGIIFNPKEQNSVIAKEEIGKIFQQKGVELVAFPASDDNELKKALSDVIAAKPDMVYLPSDTFILGHGEGIIQALTAAKIPTYGSLEKYIDKQGAVIGIVSSYKSVGQELASNASEVFKGKAPSEVPSKTLPSNMQTIKVNSKTAQQVGFEIPYEILSVAQVVE